MLPQIVLITVPIPSLLLLLLLTLYHLTPLLSLLPNVHLMPTLHRLSKIIPHPRKRTLPRAFFNLPPRPSSPTSLEDVYVIGIRGKVMLVLLGQALICLACGWAYLATSPIPQGISGSIGSWWQALLASVSITPLPAAIFSLTLYATRSGITHETIFKRIIPLSSTITVIVAGVSAGIASHSSLILSISTSLLVGAILVFSVSGLLIKLRPTPRHGRIRLEASPPPVPTPRGLAELKEGESWVSSPSQKSTTDVSAFSYSPSVATPKRKRSRHFEGLHDEDSPRSWVSSPTNTPSTIPSWEYSPSVASPEPAKTRPASPRSPSPTIAVEPTVDAHDRLPQPPVNRALDRVKASQATTAGNTTRTHTTLTGTPGSVMLSPGGSIIAGYEPDPHRPLPRGFESLTSYPLSPSQLQSFGASPYGNYGPLGGSRISLATRAARSGEDMAFIPEERPSISGNGSTWTLETYHSASEVILGDHSNFKTPSRTPAKDRRAPPPPPIPMGLPLPPTPTASGSRSPTTTVWEGKDSAEYLLGEREWVEVECDGDGLDGWNRDSRGIGLVAVLMVLCHLGLVAPMLVFGLLEYTQILFMVSLLMPAPALLVASYLLRYRALPTTRQRRKKESTRSESTRKSLALLTESQLSLPLSISPKLTPPNEKRSGEPTARWSHFLETKPSVSNFGYNRPRPHTVYGNTEATQFYTETESEQDRLARKTMTRRSTDIWLENGHAVQDGSRLSRVGEMLKPVPAMRMLDPYVERPQHKAVTRLRGGVVSMLSNRLSSYMSNPGTEMQDLGADAGKWAKEGGDQAPDSPITIQVTSPSKCDVNRASRASGVSEMTGDWDDPEDIGRRSLPTAQIHEAQRGRMSAGPTVVLGKQSDQDELQLDWLAAGVLPNLVPNLQIGSDVKIGPTPRQVSRQFHKEDGRNHPDRDQDFTPAKGSIIRRSHTSLNSISSFDFSATPVHSHGHSTSIDFTSPDGGAVNHSTPHQNIRKRGPGLKHKSSFSLPSIHAADFEDVRRSFDDCGRPHPDALDSSDHASDHMGVDLPPFPAHLVSGHGRPDLTTVTERDESNESSRMRQTLYDMGDAILALSSSPQVNGDVSMSSTASNLRRARGLGDLAPIMINSSQVGNFTFSTLADQSPARQSESSSPSKSLLSDEEAMAEEMERVMAMDTPTRIEFVISPPPSSYASSFGSRSNSRASHRTNPSDEVVPPVPKVDWRYSTPGQTSSEAGQFTDAEDEIPPLPPRPTPSDVATPQMSELDESLQHATVESWTYAHPYPPPTYQINAKPSISTLNQGSVTANSPHPPVSVPQQLLRNKNSTETMRSDMTGTTGTTDATTPHHRFTTEEEPFKPSRQELMLVRTLKERREIARRSAQIDKVDHEPKHSPVKRSRSVMGLTSPVKQRPLQELSHTSNQNKGSMEASEVSNQAQNGVVKKKIGVLGENGLPKGSLGSQNDVKSVKGSKGTTPAMREKAGRKKGSKISTGSGVTPLRA